MPTPIFSGAASLRELRFNQLTLRHQKRWKNGATIVDAYLDKFHGQGRVLVVNVGPNRRVTLKSGFTAHVDQPVNRKNLRACQWKGKSGKHSRLRWTKHGEHIRGRDTTKLKVECGEYSIGVTSAPTGIMYGFKEGVFARGLYITTKSVVEFVGGDGRVHQVQIRKKKKSSEPMDKVVRVLGINVQTASVSQFAASYEAPLKCEYVSSDDSEGYHSEETVVASSSERGQAMVVDNDLPGHFSLDANDISCAKALFSLSVTGKKSSGKRKTTRQTSRKAAA